MKKTLLIASLGLAFFLPSAEAGVFDFSFTLADSRVLSGKIDGTLQADNNSVFVNSILDFASFDELQLPSLTYLTSSDSTGNRMVTFDGSYMNLTACSDISCGVFFRLNANSERGHRELGDSFIEMRSPTYFGESFNPANWQLTSSSESLPVPATLPLLVMGGMVMAYRRRKYSQRIHLHSLFRKHQR